MFEMGMDFTLKQGTFLISVYVKICEYKIS